MKLMMTATVALALAGAARAADKPTVVLVHGAFAGSSSWNPVARRLLRDGYPVVAAANPLRGVKVDAAYVAHLIRTIPGPVVLVGHSYGGEVISVAAADAPNVRSLVFVSGFAPEVGESADSLSRRFPTGTLARTLAPPVPLPDGGRDLYIVRGRYHAQFAADLPTAEAGVMAATQRPVTEAALAEPVGAAAWKTLPSRFIWGSADRNIPAALARFMAARAKPREAVEAHGASHVVMVSHPQQVAAMVERAAADR